MAAAIIKRSADKNVRSVVHGMARPQTACLRRNNAQASRGCFASEPVCYVLHDASILGSPGGKRCPKAMARTLELTLASVLTLMGGVYLLRSSRAEQARHQAELAAAVARRASLSAALLEARAALESERRWQGDERANLTRALQQRRRRRRIPPSPYQAKPFVPVATTTTPVATAPVATPSPITQLKDFPCALRDFKVAKVTKTANYCARRRPAPGR